MIVCSTDTAGVGASWILRRGLWFRLIVMDILVAVHAAG